MLTTQALTLAPAALLVLVAYVAGITAFGTWLGRRRAVRARTTSWPAGAVPWWAIAACIVATETSTLTFIGAPGTAYSGDWTFLQLVFGYVLGRLLIAAVFLPAYFRGEIFTSYELLQRRFGGAVRAASAGDLPALPHARRRHPPARRGPRPGRGRGRARSGGASSPWAWP